MYRLRMSRKRIVVEFDNGLTRVFSVRIMGPVSPPWTLAKLLSLTHCRRFA
jgi:hypothetical protein